MYTLMACIIALLAATSAAAQSGPFQQTCSYSNKTEPVEDAATEVLCTMRYTAIPNGLRYSFRFGGRTVVFETNSNSTNDLWSSGRLNGMPAIMLELWRGSNVAVTTDMRISFEWRDRGAPKYPAN